MVSGPVGARGADRRTCDPGTIGGGTRRAGNMNRFFGWLLGLEDVVSIDEIEPTLAAPWAADEYGPFWVVLAIAAGLAGSLAFYLRWQDRGSRAARTALGVARGALLGLLILTLAEPVLRLTTTSRQAPTVYVLIDGTDSMGIRDPMTPSDRATLDKAVGLAPPDAPQRRASLSQRHGRPPGGGSASGAGEPVPSRIDYVRGAAEEERRRVVEAARTGTRRSPAAVRVRWTNDEPVAQAERFRRRPIGGGRSGGLGRQAHDGRSSHRARQRARRRLPAGGVGPFGGRGSGERLRPAIRGCRP